MRKGGAGEGSPMANVEHRDARVRRKSASSYVWTKVSPNQDLYRRESIQTGEASGAVLRLSDGSTLEMKENSLVIIDDVNNLATGFLQGSMILHRESGDAAISVGNDGKAKIEELSVSLIKPEALSGFFVGKSALKNLPFKWKMKPEARTPAAESSLGIQVSTDQRFSAKRTETFAVDSKSAAASTLTAPLKAGTYFWRVIRNSEVLSTVGRFAIISGDALRPIWPTHGSPKIQISGNDGIVQFRWLDPQADRLADPRVTHELEIATDPLFKSVVVTKSIAAASGIARVSGIPMGAFFWRTKSQFGDLTLTSEPENFSLEQAQKLPIELLKPEKEAAVSDHALRFNWSPDSPGAATEYTFELENAAKAVTILKTGATSLLLKETAAGAYRWRVRALAQAQTVGESEWRALTVEQGSPLELTLPLKNQEIRFWKQRTAFEFQWTSDPLVQKPDGGEYFYNLEIASEKDFRTTEFKVLTATLKSKKNSVDSAALKIPDGSYFWRVQIVDKAGLVIKKSEASRFAYGTHPPLKFPVSAQPVHGTSVNPLETEKDPVLSWSAVEGGEAYELTVILKAAPAHGSRAPAAEKTLIKNVTKERLFELKPIGDGTYSWSVRAVDVLGRLGEPMPAQDLIVNSGAPLAAPEALSKEVQ